MRTISLGPDGPMPRWMAEQILDEFVREMFESQIDFDMWLFETVFEPIFYKPGGIADKWRANYEKDINETLAEAHLPFTFDQTNDTLTLSGDSRELEELPNIYRLGNLENATNDDWIVDMSKVFEPNYYQSIPILSSEFEKEITRIHSLPANEWKNALDSALDEEIRRLTQSLRNAIVDDQNDRFMYFQEIGPEFIAACWYKDGWDDYKEYFGDGVYEFPHGDEEFYDYFVENDFEMTTRNIAGIELDQNLLEEWFTSDVDPEWKEIYDKYMVDR